MTLDHIREFFSNLGRHDLPTGVAARPGIVLLGLVFKTGKFFKKLMFPLIAAGRFRGSVPGGTHPNDHPRNK